MAKTKRHRRFSWYIIWFLVFFFLFGAAFSVLVSLPLWRITSVDVLGTQIIAKRHIERAASKFLGENIILADYSPLKGFLGGIHQIKDFGIWRRLPSTLVIKVIERRPFAVANVAGTSVIIDEDGFYLKAEGRARQTGDYSFILVENISGLPVVKGIKASKDFTYRLDPDVSEAIADSIKRLCVFLPDKSLQLDMSETDDINLLVDDILRVRLGDTEDIAQKISVLEALLPQVEGKWGDVYYIDIRAAQSPVIKWKKPKKA